jgi:predicted TIM-barrel fold metal-dependent hydrolase
MITDSQVHLWRASSPQHPWPTDTGHEPQRAEPLEPAELFGMMKETGVDRAVVVPPIWIGDDNEDALTWARQYPQQLAVMGRFDLWSADRRRLDHWFAQPGILGIRMSYPAHRGWDWLDPDEFGWFWSSAQRLGIPVMILCQGQAWRLLPLARRYPDLALIVDHIGLQAAPRAQARAGAPGRLETIEDMIALAEFPRVYGKFSSLATYAGQPFPFDRLTEPLRRVFEALGSQRLMWGSDISRMSLLPFPVSYQETFDHVRQLEFLDDSDKDWIFGRTAETVLRWPSEGEADERAS